MNTRKAVYAASLDPITYGHINVIERVAPLYDEVIVLVAVNERKSYLFTAKERTTLAKAELSHLPNVRVEISLGCYVVKHAEALGATILVRGLRNAQDLEEEEMLAEENRKICPTIETIWIPRLPHLKYVSSSIVRGHIGIDPGWTEQIARFVTPSVARKVKEKFLVGKAQKHWVELIERLGNPKGSEEVLTELLNRYTESHRFYHTIEHIVSMLDELSLLKLDNPAIDLAVWFHDAIYDTKAKDNEETSAAVAKDRILSLGLSGTLAEMTAALIMDTKHTRVPGNLPAQILIDLDLIILGKSEKEFDQYEAGIREEYKEVPEAEFQEVRAGILQRFFDRPSIYLTEVFRNKYESAARKNLARSIAALRS